MKKKDDKKDDKKKDAPPPPWVYHKWSFNDSSFSTNNQIMILIIDRMLVI